MITCAYYRMRFDRTLWAMRIELTSTGPKILQAVGPLHENQVRAEPPMAHHSPIVDSRDWMPGAFEQIGGEWAMARRTRMQGGLSRPGKVDVQESEEGFSVCLLPGT